MRIAMLGAGAMAGFHAGAWSRLEGVEVAWVVGRGSDRAARIDARLGARVAADPRAAVLPASPAAGLPAAGVRGSMPGDYQYGAIL